MHRYKLLLRMMVATALCVPVAAWAQNNTDQQKTAIRTMLQRQVEAWNRHDLEGFMAGYWRSPELTFFSNDTVTRGWEPTLKRYQAKYQAAGKEMGTLDFFDLEVTPLSPDAAFVRGHWHLRMKDGSEPGGLFTLIVRKFPDGWKIVHDHTS